MVLAYSINGHDNSSYMYEHRRGPGYCHVCSAKINPVVNPGFRLRNRKLDLSHTYDDYLIVSQKFKDFCDRGGLENIKFHSFERESGFYFFEAMEVLKFDSERRGTEFIDKCNACGIYKHVAGATPAFLKNTKEPIAKGFFRTDVQFGESHSRFPLIIVGIQTFDALKKEKLLGLTYKKIEQ